LQWSLKDVDTRHKGGHDRGGFGVEISKAVMAGLVPAIHVLFAMVPENRGYPPQGLA
jgi:hypothetical protein